VVGENLFLVYSPEREDPGNPVFETRTIPKVVGGHTPACRDVGVALYSPAVDRLVPVSSTKAAEMTKLLENIHRAVNIGLVNEMKIVADRMGIDIFEVIDAAATKPFGFQAFYPGPGVGGHCIPLDPQFLAWRAKELKVATRFIDLAEDVNLHMPDYIVSRIASLLNDRGRSVHGTRILGVGAAYKKNIADDRESPSIDVLRLLARRGAELGVLDPHVPQDRLARHGFDAVPDDADLSTWNLAIILTDHDATDYAALADSVETVFDTRGVYRRQGIHRDNVVIL
jgi:UDP-N-acetyl-D-glucosamine dehydrogenase